MHDLTPNEGKKLEIEVDGQKWARFPVKTHVVFKGENIVNIAKKYAKPYLMPSDLLFSSEKVIAITQGRAYNIKDVKPSKIAKLLVKFVFKSPYGIGLKNPVTMELAIREIGLPKILAAAVVSAITKPFGIRGVFYKIAGGDINAIDGPCPHTLPPYNQFASLGPKNPDQIAKKLKKELGSSTVIVDANDLGVRVLGRSSEKISKEFCEKVFKDNPLGQSQEQTPLCIVRKIN